MGTWEHEAKDSHLYYYALGQVRIKELLSKGEIPLQASKAVHEAGASVATWEVESPLRLESL